MAVIPVPEDAAVTLRVLHETAYAYDAPVELAHHLGHLRPRATPLQRVCEWQLSVAPQPDVGDDDPDGPVDGSDCHVTVSPGVHQSVDPWGNHRASFSHSRVHDRLVVVSSFVVEVDPLPTLHPEASPPWEAVAERLRYRPGAGRRPNRA